MNPSAGVVQQMLDEAKAASELGLDWKVLIHSGSDLSVRVTRWPLALQYALLRVRFYRHLIELAQQGHHLVVRYSVGDPFQLIASLFWTSYFTVHHTLEEHELSTAASSYARLQLVFERFFGSKVISRARGIICKTHEIAQYELKRVAQRPSRRVVIYPNGILYLPDAVALADRRRQTPEVIFVASRFFVWHGLDALLHSMRQSSSDGCLHVVGTLPDALRNAAAADRRVRLHGVLNQTQLNSLFTQSWIGLSSFGLAGKGMTEACTLKVREYLRAGVPVYGGHTDSALPVDFPYYRNGVPNWDEVIAFARAMRDVPRMTVASAAEPWTDLRILLQSLYRALEAGDTGARIGDGK